MPEYIDREAARESACKDCTYRIPIFCDAGCAYPKPCHKLLSAFLEAESSDVAPVVHGRWELDHADTEDSSFDVVRCSTCGYKAYAISVHIRNGNYCPVCGAKMDGGEKPND